MWSIYIALRYHPGCKLLSTVLFSLSASSFENQQKTSSLSHSPAIKQPRVQAHSLGFQLLPDQSAGILHWAITCGCLQTDTLLRLLDCSVTQLRPLLLGGSLFVKYKTKLKPLHSDEFFQRALWDGQHSPTILFLLRHSLVLLSGISSEPGLIYIPLVKLKKHSWVHSIQVTKNPEFTIYCRDRHLDGKIPAQGSSYYRDRTTDSA